MCRAISNLGFSWSVKWGDGGDPPGCPGGAVHKRSSPGILQLRSCSPSIRPVVKKVCHASCPLNPPFHIWWILESPNQIPRFQMLIIQESGKSVKKMLGASCHDVSKWHGNPHEPSIILLQVLPHAIATKIGFPRLVKGGLQYLASVAQAKKDM